MDCVVQRDWEADQAEKLYQAEDLYDRSVQQVGEAHSQAVTQVWLPSCSYSFGSSEKFSLCFLDLIQV